MWGVHTPCRSCRQRPHSGTCIRHPIHSCLPFCTLKKAQTSDIVSIISVLSLCVLIQRAIPTRRNSALWTSQNRSTFIWLFRISRGTFTILEKSIVENLTHWNLFASNAIGLETNPCSPPPLPYISARVNDVLFYIRTQRLDTIQGKQRVQLNRAERGKMCVYTSLLFVIFFVIGCWFTLITYSFGNTL